MTSLRVIAVGAHEAAQALRRDPQVELVRAEDPLDAVGELARPMEESSLDTAVIVESARLPDDEAAAFVAAARSASAGVTLLSVGDRVEGFDGVWTDDDEPEAAAEPESAPEGGEETPALELSGDDVDHGALEAHLELFLRGRATRESALAAVSEGLGAPASLRETDGADGVLVERRGRRFGWLVAPGVSPERLRSAATHLASWLALDEQVEQLRTAAFVDDLTGAWNRGFFRRHLPRALDAARASRRDITLMVYDIDNFKHYNDSYGHGAGDEILRETVKLLQSVIRPSDRVCRIGGDEFAVIFDDPSGARAGGATHPRTIGEIARRFQQQICEHRFPALGDGAHATLTISGGLATFPWDGADAETLLAAADRLLLDSKRRGKNALTLGPGAQAVCRLHDPDEDETR